MRAFLFVAALIFSLTTSSDLFAESFQANRLNNAKPIVTSAMFNAAGATPYEGESINGSSAIRIPDWIGPANRADPSANYYLYFAHHRGQYIRMAWSKKIEGPYHLYSVGSGIDPENKGVLSLGPQSKIQLDNDIEIKDHVASPDVHVDHANKRIVLYFHGVAYVNNQRVGQRTFVATSSNGLNFKHSIIPVIVGKSNFRAFQYADQWFTISNRGEIYKARNANQPWVAGENYDYRKSLWMKVGNPFSKNLEKKDLSMHVRHASIRVVDHELQVFYSRIFDTPERILMTTIDLNRNAKQWENSFPPKEILRAKHYWEGSHRLATPSRPGRHRGKVENQLRDPFIFEDLDGKLYLFYSGGGESAIGVARLDNILP